VILLDTHALLWLLEDSPRLWRKAARLASAALRVDGLAVSATSFWEVAHLIQRRRLRLDGSASFRTAVLEMGVREMVVDGAVSIAAADVATSLHDPADCHIVATAVQHGARLMTADERIISAKVVATIDATA
jgi:PIN domain nuclease of toxin-antitoxin system